MPQTIQQLINSGIIDGNTKVTIKYHYDLNKVIGFTYNDGEEKNYIYRRNIQGDIIGIYDNEGNEVGIKRLFYVKIDDSKY